MCIYGLNSHWKCNFKIIFEKKTPKYLPTGPFFCMLCMKCLSKAFAHFLRHGKSERKIFWSRFYYNRNTLQESGNNCVNRTSHSIYSKLKVYHITQKCSTSLKLLSLLCELDQMYYFRCKYWAISYTYFIQKSWCLSVKDLSVDLVKFLHGYVYAYYFSSL